MCRTYSLLEKKPGNTTNRGQLPGRAKSLWDALWATLSDSLELSLPTVWKWGDIGPVI